MYMGNDTIPLCLPLPLQVRTIHSTDRHCNLETSHMCALTKNMYSGIKVGISHKKLKQGDCRLGASVGSINKILF